MCEGMLSVVRQQLTRAMQCDAERDSAGAAFHQWLAAGWLELAVEAGDGQA